MAPVLKIDPVSGESLDKAKTPEQIVIEQAANEKFYSERKKRVKSPKKKKQEVIKEDLVVVVNPFLAQNTDPVVTDMIEPFNKLLKDCEKYLKTMSIPYINLEKKLNLLENHHIILNRPKNSLNVIFDSDYSINEHIPREIQYFPNYSTIPKDADVFAVDGFIPHYKNNIVVDRVWFKPLDVREMLKHPKESKKVLLKLIQQMFQEMTVVKFLKPINKYIGTTVASINIPGQKNKYAVNFKDEMIEIRLWSDISESS